MHEFKTFCNYLRHYKALICEIVNKDIFQTCGNGEILQDIKTTEQRMKGIIKNVMPLISQLFTQDN